MTSAGTTIHPSTTSRKDKRIHISLSQQTTDYKVTKSQTTVNTSSVQDKLVSETQNHNQSSAQTVARDVADFTFQNPPGARFGRIYILISGRGWICEKIIALA